MSKQKYRIYEETWFCVLVYFIFFPIGLTLAIKSRKISNDIKNLLKFGVILLILIYSYFAASFLRYKDNHVKQTLASETYENLDVVNKDEFIKQGNITIKDIQKLLSKYKAKVSTENVDEAKDNVDENERKDDNKDKGVSSSGNMVKVKGDPYEYNISYNTSTEGDIGKVDVLVTVKYPPECVLDFNNSQFMKEILAVMEGSNYDFDTFANWVEKSEDNYSGKNVINSSVYSRKVSDVEEVLNFNTGKSGILQVNFSKKVTID